ncbi:MAG: hypothetical protein JWM31_749 [Solirubrobacterales bacterium]|nr:hypothetical protein [Solirubrobacterales bacterium]
MSMSKAIEAMKSSGMTSDEILGVIGGTGGPVDAATFAQVNDPAVEPAPVGPPAELADAITPEQAQAAARRAQPGTPGRGRLTLQAIKAMSAEQLLDEDPAEVDAAIRAGV